MGGSVANVPWPVLPEPDTLGGAFLYKERPLHPSRAVVVALVGAGVVTGSVPPRIDARPPEPVSVHRWVLSAAPPGPTAQEAPRACSGTQFRAFDYWVGEWVVRDAEGARVGTSRVSVRSDGCALLEEWSGSSGSTGISVNFHDEASGSWHQEWVGGSGLILHLAGNLREGVMTLEGTRETSRGTVRDRLRWIPLDDGRVEQHWEISVDGGTGWETVFQGFYEPSARQGILPHSPDPTSPASRSSMLHPRGSRDGGAPRDAGTPVAVVAPGQPGRRPAA